MILALGFRPFYLGAALFASLAVPAWVAAYHGWYVPGSHLPGSAWHAHEMLFGFAAAVMTGFLLTAARNWTGLPTASGAGLGALVALWCAGRVLNLAGPDVLAACIDAAFLPVVAVVLAVPLVRSRNYRNLFVVPLLGTLGALNLLHHGAFLGWSTGAFEPLPQSVAVSVAAGLIALLMTVIGGRVIPAFSANAVSGLRPKSWRSLEWLVQAGMLLIPVLDASPVRWGLPDPVMTGLLAFVGVAQAMRLLGWQPWRTRHNGLLLMLPLAYAWIPIYLLLRAALGAVGPGVPSLALHALLVGGMASLMLAMMTRSALGHTGRPLRAGSIESVSFFAMQAAAVLRVAGPLAMPGAYGVWITLSGVAATLAFATYAAGYWPVLTRPRVDGRAG